MKNRLLVLATLIVFLVACQQAEWKEFNSHEGAFSILMPGTPTEKTQKTNTKAGDIDFHMFVFEHKGYTYMVAYNDYPEAVILDSNPDKLLDAARDGAVKNAKGTLLGERIVSIDKYLGRELRIKQVDGAYTLRARVFLIKNRLYQVVLTTPKEEAFSQDMDKFFDSFKLPAQ